MKVKRTEYDVIGEKLVRQVKMENPDFKLAHLVRLFGRTYSNLLKQQKEAKESL